MTTPRSAPLDPWNDAETIARRLATPNAELLVALGAEAWCEKCRALRPAFESLCKERAPASMTWLWLDLEEHAEFLRDFVPGDLPLLLRWRLGQLRQVAVLEGIDLAAPAGAAAERLRALPLTPDVPDLWAALSTQDWAT